MIEAKWRTNRQYPLTDFQLFRLTQFDSWQASALNLEQSDIAARVSTYQLGFQLTTIRQAHDDFIGIGNHMVIGQHVAISGNDKARPQRLASTLATATRRTRHLRDIALKELAEHRRHAFEIRHIELTAAGDCAIRHLLPGTDIDNRR